MAQVGNRLEPSQGKGTFISLPWVRYQPSQDQVWASRTVWIVATQLGDGALDASKPSLPLRTTPPTGTPSLRPIPPPHPPFPHTEKPLCWSDSLTGDSLRCNCADTTACVEPMHKSAFLPWSSACVSPELSSKSIRHFCTSTRCIVLQEGWFHGICHVTQVKIVKKKKNSGKGRKPLLCCRWVMNPPWPQFSCATAISNLLI